MGWYGLLRFATVCYGLLRVCYGFATGLLRFATGLLYVDGMIVTGLLRGVATD